MLLKTSCSNYALTKYIPTESLTLYVATVSSQKALSTVLPGLTAEVAYNFFVPLTPLLMLVLFLRKLSVAGLAALFVSTFLNLWSPFFEKK